jgi:hypothetical protein
MGTGRKLRKAPMVRPKKNACERRRRDKTQKKRLVSLGLPEEEVNKMTTRQVKDLLKRPAKIGKKPAAK